MLHGGARGGVSHSSPDMDMRTRTCHAREQRQLAPTRCRRPLSCHCAPTKSMAQRFLCTHLRRRCQTISSVHMGRQRARSQRCKLTKPFRQGLAHRIKTRCRETKISRAARRARSLGRKRYGSVRNALSHTARVVNMSTAGHFVICSASRCHGNGNHEKQGSQSGVGREHTGSR